MWTLSKMHAGPCVGGNAGYVLCICLYLVHLFYFSPNTEAKIHNLCCSGIEVGVHTFPHRLSLRGSKERRQKSLGASDWDPSSTHNDRFRLQPGG